MHLKFYNVNDAFFNLVELFGSEGRVKGCQELFTRKPYTNPNGSGYRLQIMEPVTITYAKPQQRVLFNNARDGNPFFHLYEALWMLAGRNDVAPLKYYCSNIDFCSDDKETFNGAYGYRWRHPEVDQLQEIISLLRETPESSRAVLAMWNVEDDLMKARTSKDVCCNLSVVFSITGVKYPPDEAFERKQKGTGQQALDITVFNRSNDLIWGALGTNYVHFSILQEYVAANLGVEVGHYHQCTSNLHTYDYNFKPNEWLECGLRNDYTKEEQYRSGFSSEKFVTVPIVKDPKRFDEELPRLVSKYTGNDRDYLASQARFSEPFLDDVAQPMFAAFKCYKAKAPHSALVCADEIKSDDWRTAAEAWLRKRIK